MLGLTEFKFEIIELENQGKQDFRKTGEYGGMKNFSMGILREKGWFSSFYSFLEKMGSNFVHITYFSNSTTFTVTLLACLTSSQTVCGTGKSLLISADMGTSPGVYLKYRTRVTKHACFYCIIIVNTTNFSNSVSDSNCLVLHVSVVPVKRACPQELLLSTALIVIGIYLCS